MNGAARWAFGAVLPLAMSNLACEREPRPPEIRSAADLPAAMAWALEGTCRFEPRIDAVGGCLCEAADRSTLTIASPRCDPPPRRGERAFVRLERIGEAMRAHAAGNHPDELRARALWRLVWSDEPAAAEGARLDLEAASRLGGATGERLSDLAAGQLLSGLRGRDAELILQAADSAERAFAAGPRLPAAAWNRALAWASARLDSIAAGAFADLATTGPHDLREAATRLATATAVALAPSEWSRCEDRLESGEDCAGEELRNAVASNPQRAREWGEEEALGRWGERWLAGEAADAERWRSIAERLGESLDEATGEGLLQSAAEHLSKLAVGQRERAARALVDYREAQRASRAFEVDRADEGFRRAESGLGATGSPLRIRALLGLVIRDYQTGRFDDARRTADRAAALLAGARAPSAAARLDWIRGTLDGAQGLEILGDLSWSRAVGRLWELRNFEDAATLESMRGALAVDLGDGKGAARSTLAALADLPRFSQPWRQIQVLIVAGYSLRRLGDFALSARLLEQAARLAQDSGRPVDAVYAWIDLAENQLARGESHAAPAAIHAARAMVPRVEPEELRTYLLGEIEMVESEALLGADPAAALAAADRASDRYRAAREQAKLDRVRRLRANALRALGRPSESFAELVGSLRSALADRLSSAANQVALTAKIEGLYQLAIEVAADDLSRPEQALDLLLERMAWRSGGLEAGESGAFGGGVAAFREWLAPGELAVVLEGGDDEVRIWSVDADGVRYRRAQLSMRELLRADPGLGAGSTEAAAGIGSRLGDLLPREVLASSDGAVFLVVGEPLAGLAFESWGERDDASAQRRRPVVRLEAWRPADPRPHRARPAGEPLGVVVLADPAFDEERFAGLPRLSGARSEAAVWPRRFPAAKTLQGDMATRRALRELAPSADVLVLSAHALTSRSARESVLLLAPDTSAADDGVMTAAEIGELRLERRPLVVLAGCSTARAAGDAGLGTESLARAFLRAGAGTVLATLEDVDDAAVAAAIERLAGHLAEARARGGSGHDPSKDWSILDDLSSTPSGRRMPFVVVTGGAFRPAGSAAKPR